LGIGFGRVIVPQLEVPASQTNVTMTYPGEWIPLYEGFSRRSQLWTPDFGMVLLFLALALWIERLLAWLSVPLLPRMLMALAGGLAATIVFTFMVLVIVACSALTIAWIATIPMRQRVGVSVAIGVVALVVFLAVMASNVSMRKYEAASGEYSAPTSTVASRAPQAPEEQKDVSGFAYQGLPAKFELPTGSRRSDFAQELLRTDREQSVLVVAVSMALVKWLGLLIAIAVVIALLRERKTMVETFRAHMRSVRNESTATA